MHLQPNFVCLLLLLQAHASTEVEDFVSISSALLINVGTLSPDWVESMKLAAAAAVRLGKVWVLDPVGCGATPYRSQVGGGTLRVPGGACCGKVASVAEREREQFVRRPFHHHVPMRRLITY